MAVTARFYVSEVTHRAYNPAAAQVKLQATTRGDENKGWATATPSGSIDMAIQNPDAAAFFAARLGQDIAITFESIDDARYPNPYQDAPIPAA
jgi:hypothetical protein